MSTGFATLASDGSSSASRDADSSESVGKLQPRGLARVGRQDPEAAGVRQDGDAPAERERLRGEEHRDVDELLEALGPDHTRLVEERVDRGVRARERGRVRSCRLRSRGRPPALEREDRLRARDAARDARELARVAERFEVEDDQARLVVDLEPLEHVVRGDVGLVADRDERREADAARLGRLDHREPERAALRREADRAPPRRLRREGCVEPRGGCRDAEAVRADQPRAVRAHEREEPLLPLDALGADLREARRR